MCPSHTLFPKQHIAAQVTKTRQIVLIFFGETSPGKLLFWIVEALRIGPIGCPETSVINLFFTNSKVMYSCAIAMIRYNITTD